MQQENIKYYTDQWTRIAKDRFGDEGYCTWKGMNGVGTPGVVYFTDDSGKQTFISAFIDYATPEIEDALGGENENDVGPGSKFDFISSTVLGQFLQKYCREASPNETKEYMFS